MPLWTQSACDERYHASCTRVLVIVQKTDCEVDVFKQRHAFIKMLFFLHVDHRWTGPAVLRQTSVRIVSTEENLLDAPEGFDERDEEIF